MVVQFYRKQSSESIPLFVGKSCVGRIIGDTYLKSGTIFMKHQAWAIEPSTLSQLKEHNVQWLEFHDKYSSLTYCISFENFLRHGFMAEEPWGRRYFCPIKQFEISGAEQLRLEGVSSRW